MTAQELLKTLRYRGHKVERRSQRLWIEPTPAHELLESCRAHKQELLELVARDNPEAWPDAWSGDWCLVESEAVGERVLWTRDDDVQPPMHLRNVPRYTWAEITQLIADGVEPDTLRTIHAVKTILGARVIVGES